MPTEDDLHLLVPTIQSRIQTTLRSFDRELSRLERQAAEQNIASVLYNEINDLTLERQELFQERIQAIRKILSTIKSDLRLEPERQNVSSLIWGRCAFLQVDLMNIETKRLRGYGEPPQWLFEYLDPLLQELIVLLTDVFLSEKHMG